MKQPVILTPLPDDFEFGPEFDKLQEEARPDTVARIASIVSRFDGSNETDLAREVCYLIFGGGPLQGE